MSNIESIAAYFDRQLEVAPEGKTLPVFFEQIEDEQIRIAVVEEAKQYTDAHAAYEEESGRTMSFHHFACNAINARLRKEFDLPAGDWTWVAMMNAVRGAA